MARNTISSSAYTLPLFHARTYFLILKKNIFKWTAFLHRLKKREVELLSLVDINVTNVKMTYRNISLMRQIFGTNSFRAERPADVSGGRNRNDWNPGLEKAGCLLTDYAILSSCILCNKNETSKILWKEKPEIQACLFILRSDVIWASAAGNVRVGIRREWDTPSCSHSFYWQQGLKLK